MNIFVLDKGEYKYSSARKFFPGQNGEKSAVIILLRSMNIKKDINYSLYHQKHA